MHTEKAICYDLFRGILTHFEELKEDTLNLYQALYHPQKAIQAA